MYKRTLFGMVAEAVEENCPHDALLRGKSHWACLVATPKGSTWTAEATQGHSRIKNEVWLSRVAASALVSGVATCTPTAPADTAQAPCHVR